jgi:hypothetical protein
MFLKKKLFEFFFKNVNQQYVSKSNHFLNNTNSIDSLDYSQDLDLNNEPREYLLFYYPFLSNRKRWVTGKIF